MLTYHVQHAHSRRMGLQPILLLRNSVAAAIGLCSSTVPSTCRRTPASRSLFTTLFQFINVVSSRPFHFNRLHGRRHRSRVCAHLHHHPAAAAAAASAAASSSQSPPCSFQFALNYPSKVKAVVLAGGAGRYNEATTYQQFKKISNSQAAAWYFATLLLHKFNHLTGF